MLEQKKEDQTDNKDTEEEETKQVEEVSVSETNQGKTSPVEEKNLEQVEHEVIAEVKTTHIEKTIPDPKNKTLATDQTKKDDGGTSAASIANQGRESLQEESSGYSAGHAVKGTGVKLLDINRVSSHALISIYCQLSTTLITRLHEEFRIVSIGASLEFLIRVMKYSSQ
ncbi:hypothetical protein DY000_02049508 [Brassica cretica]|uniref:Uncharacterized protein n=1 Tax=Brassica cretica TaxID=69181 RepID=A0ABQ7EYI3_BRACR|nr:hypothetical protein DY000_02049508 [Brassica cretica]